MNNSLRSLILFFCFIIFTHPAFGQIPELKGKTDCVWGSDDCNPCVKDVVGSFNRLRVNGDVLGFHVGAYPNPTYTDHWQGIQRIMVDDGQYLVVSRLNNLSFFSDFAVVAIDSQGHGTERLRSNRLGWHTDINDTAPPAPDMIFHEEVVDGVLLNHAGGIQMLGRILAVPLEDSLRDDYSQIRFFDMTYPTNPRVIGKFDRFDPDAASVSMAQLKDGYYLLIVGGDTKPLHFYVSGAPHSLSSFWEFGYGRPGEFNDYQNIDLVTDCNDGDLYLIGTYNNGDIGFNEDWAELFSLRNGEDGSIDIDRVSSLHLDCGYRDKDQCNFRAAAGTYVDSKNQLYLYSTEHENNGPDESIKMMEFRPVPHDTCEDINSAWVEVYENPNFEYRSLMIDYPDRYKEDYANYSEIDDFNDKTSSVHWCIPPGWSYELWENTNFSGNRVVLQGNGQLQGILDLNVSNGFADKTSSSRWVTQSQYTLNVSKSGNGRLTSVPSGIDCGSDCSENYSSGTVVEVFATADPGWRFVRWSGACIGDWCQITMNSDKSAIAEFTPTQVTYTLTTNKTGDGDGRILSDPSGINCGLYCNASFASGTVVDLSVTDFIYGSRLVGWQGDCSGTECQLRMDGNKNVTAVFAPEIKYRLTVATAGVGTGTVTSNPAGINCGGDCGEDYAQGTSVALTADAAEGSKFVSWSGSCAGSNPTCRVLMSQTRSTTANFDVYVPANFTDDPLQPRVTVVKQLHVRELRDAINALRNAYGLSDFTFTDAGLTRGYLVRAIHITDLRTALNDVYDHLGRTRPAYTDPNLQPKNQIRADHIQQIRNAYRAVD